MTARPKGMSARQWRRWSPAARETFLFIWGHREHVQRPILHPDMELLPQAHWDTLCWNFAWQAAEAAQEFATQEIAA